MTLPRFLTADDIAKDLGVSRTIAYERMKEMTRVVTGRLVRVSRQAYSAWLERHRKEGEWGPENDATFSSAEESGGDTSAPKASADSESRLASRQPRRARKRSPSGSNGSAEGLRPTMPRKRRA